MARTCNGGAGKRLHRPGRQRIHPDILAAEIDGKITHRRLERRLGHAHDIIVRRNPLRADIAEGHQRAAIRHHLACRLRDLGKGEGRDHHGLVEVPAAGVQIAALQLVLVGKGQRVNDEIDGRPVTGKPVKGLSYRAFMRDIAFHHQVGADRFRQRAQPLAEPLHLIGEGKLGTGLGGGGGDAPGAGAFIRDAHDQAPLAGKKSRRHIRPSSAPAWRWFRQSRRSSTAPM